MTRSREACPAEAVLPARHEAGDPDVLAHVQDCPRCRALLAQHRAFLESDGGAVAPTSVQLADADAALAAALEREMSGGHAPQGTAATPRTFVPEPRPSWWQGLFAPALRPVWGVAVLVIVAGGIYLSVRPDAQRGEVRGDASVSAEVKTLAPVASEGVVTLAWEPVAGADRYDVVLLSQDLSELGEPLRVDEPMCVIRHDQLPAGVTKGTPLLWQVTARAGERELSHSVTSAFVTP